MTPTRSTRPSLRLALAALLTLSLVVGAIATAVPGVRHTAAALDDHDDESEGQGNGGDLDEDDNSGKGNDDDGVDEDNSGKGNGNDKEKKGKDDETELVTAVPMATEVPSPTPTPDLAQPTQPALTPVASPTGTPSSPVTTGTLAVSLLVCPAGIDATGGTDALAKACVDGNPDAVFELEGRTGLYGGWRRNLTTGGDGTAQATKLAEGKYALTLTDLDWCAAEASNVADGLIVVEPGETTAVTAYLCGDPTVR